MNFIRDRELALRFKNNAVHSKERFLYLLIFMILFSLTTSSCINSYLYSFDINYWDISIDVIVLATTILGTYICYQTNKKGDNKEFIERYISIYFPITIQTILILIPVFFVYIIVIESFIIVELHDRTLAYEFIIMTVYMLYFYWRLNSAIRIAAN